MAPAPDGEKEEEQEAPELALPALPPNEAIPDAVRPASWPRLSVRWPIACPSASSSGLWPCMVAFLRVCWLLVFEWVRVCVYLRARCGEW